MKKTVLTVVLTALCLAGLAFSQTQLGDIFQLKNRTEASFPVATGRTGGLLYGTTAGRPYFSNGTNWTGICTVTSGCGGVTSVNSGDSALVFSPSTGNVVGTCNSATPGNNGCVDTSAQTFAGAKNFWNALTVNSQAGSVAFDSALDINSESAFTGNTTAVNFGFMPGRTGAESYLRLNGKSGDTYVQTALQSARTEAVLWFEESRNFVIAAAPASDIEENKLNGVSTNGGAGDYLSLWYMNRRGEVAMGQDRAPTGTAQLEVDNVLGGSDSTAIAIMEDTQRLDFGTGVNDYCFSNGTDIVCPSRIINGNIYPLTTVYFNNTITTGMVLGGYVFQQSVTVNNINYYKSAAGTGTTANFRIAHGGGNCDCSITCTGTGAQTGGCGGSCNINASTATFSMTSQCTTTPTVQGNLTIDGFTQQ